MSVMKHSKKCALSSCLWRMFTLTAIAVSYNQQETRLRRVSTPVPGNRSEEALSLLQSRTKFSWRNNCANNGRKSQYWFGKYCQSSQQRLHSSDLPKADFTR